MQFYSVIQYLLEYFRLLFSLHYSYHSEVIQSIVGLISRNLSYEFSEVIEGFVGIDSRVVELESCLAVGLNDVRFIGIWAMGGMGKTTLARVVYHMVSKNLKLVVLLMMLGMFLKKMVYFHCNKNLFQNFEGNKFEYRGYL
jgi:hypothetical protein